MNRSQALVTAAALALLAAGPARALSSVSVQPAVPSAVIGEIVQVDILADLSSPIVGFGFDFSFDDTIVTLTAPPSIGPAWVPVFAPDGDGLAGLTPGIPVSGDDVLLASLMLQAIAPGLTSLVVSITAGDLSEGFALDPSGFDSVSITNSLLQVVPEPTTVLLLALGLASLAAWRR